uniref:Ig-like domain-containing protein n=1 Tax=Electrophorus electricus TaxID=8005 RepID=A0A4W4GTQ5_ELEEL
IGLWHLVQVPPLPGFHCWIQAPPTSLRARIGQTVVLPCVVQGEPTPEHSWFHNGRPVGNERSLRIPAIRHSDNGTYTCVASNSAGEDHADIALHVLGACSCMLPGCRASMQASTRTAVLPCDVEGSPPPSLTWLKDSQPLVSSSLLMYVQGGRMLRLGAVRTEDAGTYTCRAKNPAGTAHSHYTLSILGKVVREVKFNVSSGLVLGSS